MPHTSQARKRTRGKKVIKPKYSNNPFFVQHIYNLTSSQQANESMLEKRGKELRPWERDYLAKVNNRFRGAHSVTACDLSYSKEGLASKNTSLIMNQTLNDFEFASQNQSTKAFKKVNSSLNRNQNSKKDEQHKIQQNSTTHTVDVALRGERSLPPLGNEGQTFSDL